MEVSNNNMQHLFERLGDLKLFFIYGEKLIKTLQKILDFMRDTVPLLENVNRSITDSTSKIPKAAVQLSSVTKSTEIATTEILDVVDGVTSDLQTIIKRLIRSREKMGSQKELIEKIINKYPDDPDISALLKDGINVNEFGSSIEMLEKIQEGMFNITLSLQVQDITAQQLASVNHLIHSIQDKLSSLLFDIESKDPKQEVETIDFKDAQDLAFNAEAKYDMSGDAQKAADAIIENNAKPSQHEIDQLFSKQ
jgi:chemotaxis regulatin CheY-phosphate phosphatase CheZ